MRCQQCDYALWGLKPGPCPECGTPFQPSEHRFEIGAVRFCCPHCQQAYYGTSQAGHLEPEVFVCTGCQQQIHLDEMILQPAGGQEAMAVSSRLIALDDSVDRWDRGYFEIMGLAFIGPSRLMDRIPPATPLLAALFPIIVTVLIVALVDLFILATVTVGIRVVMVAIIAPNVQGVPVDESFNTVKWLMETAAQWARIGAFVMVLALVGLFCWAAIVHGILIVLRGTQSNFRRTLQAVYYTSPILIIMILPCLLPVALLWWLVSSMVALSSVAKTGRVIVATLITAIVFITVPQLAAIGLVMTNPSANSAMSSMFIPNRAGSMLIALVGDTSTVPQFVLAINDPFDDSCCGPGGTLLPGITDVDLFALDQGERATFDAQCLTVMPHDAIAYRIGRVIFTLCNVPPEIITESSSDDGSNGLWVTVSLPVVGLEATAVLAGATDATSKARITQLRLNDPVALADQNTLRASRGLPPLPPLDSIPIGGVVTPEGVVIPEWPSALRH